jgi:hypothetical protein
VEAVDHRKNCQYLWDKGSSSLVSEHTESVDGAGHLNGANKSLKERVMRINDGEGDMPVDSSEIGG